LFLERSVDLENGARSLRSSNAQDFSLAPK
jgi:hypothetical protein